MTKITDVVCAFLAPILLLWASDVSAFIVVKTSTGADLKWNIPQAHYLVNPDGGPANSTEAIRAAMQTWTNVGANLGVSSFAFINDGTTTKRPGAGVTSLPWDSLNIVGFGPMGTDGTLAVNSAWYVISTGLLLDSDIQFNTNHPWATSGSPLAFDVQDVATHELGHSLGLGDVDRAGDVDKTMYGFSRPGETSQRALSPDDINGITYLYPNISLPVPTTMNTYIYPQSPDPVFSADPSQNQPFAVGDVTHGVLSLHASFLPINGFVDIYLALFIAIPPYDSSILIITPTNSLQPVEEGLVPWKANTLGRVDQMLFGDIPTSGLPKGTYYLGVVVTPAGSLNVSYFWVTQFVIQ